MTVARSVAMAVSVAMLPLDRLSSNANVTTADTPSIAAPINMPLPAALLTWPSVFVTLPTTL